MHKIVPDENKNKITEFDSDSNAIHMRIFDVENQSVESTRRMKALLAESTQAGASTLNALHEQGSQLDNIQKGLREVHEHTVEADRTLKKMNARFWGLFHYSPKKKSKKKIASEFAAVTEIEEGGIRENKKRSTEITTGHLKSSDNYIAKYTNSKEEMEMENNLKDVSDMVGSLRNLAIDMNTEISRQNPIIDHLILMSEENALRLEDAEKKCKEIINK